MTMSRRCSHCGHNGHNSRTCLLLLDSRGGDNRGGGGGFKLFGVRVSEPSLPPPPPSSFSSPLSSSSAMRKSVSMGNLPSYGSSESGSPSAAFQHEHLELDLSLDGYASDDIVHTTTSARERKKGVSWTEQEHRLFLLGLQKLGKGDWRGISRSFVKTRTPTQVASHAQKYFLRRSNINKRRRRSSLFDIIPEAVSDTKAQEDNALQELNVKGTETCLPEVHLLNSGQYPAFGRGDSVKPAAVSSLGTSVGDYSMPLASLPFSYIPPPVDEIMEDAAVNEEEGTVAIGLEAGPPGPPSAAGVTCDDNCERIANAASLLFPSFPFWAGPLYSYSDSKLIKPTPIIPAAPSHTEESEPGPVMKPSPLSYKLLEDGSRQSAFHAMSSENRSELDTKESLSSAISVA